LDFPNKIARTGNAALTLVENNSQNISLICVEMLMVAKQLYEAVRFLADFGGMSEVQTDFFKVKKSGAPAARAATELGQH
jgi:hypothetical protein